MRKEKSKLLPFLVRLPPGQIEFLRSELCPNASKFIREAITQKMEERRDQIFAKQRQELGLPTRDDLSQAPLISSPHLLCIVVPQEVWSDEALTAKVDAGWSLEELLSFLHAQIHSRFVEAFSHSHTQSPEGRSDLTDVGGTRESRQPPEETDENTGGN
jgi:hypothetical protein